MRNKLKIESREHTFNKVLCKEKEGNKIIGGVVGRDGSIKLFVCFLFTEIIAHLKTDESDLVERET